MAFTRGYLPMDRIEPGSLRAGDEYSIADLEFAYRTADLDDFSDRFMANGVASIRGKSVPVVRVQVTSANAA